ncbi:matrixin family metalloprotease [Arsukibacterium sp.]|uniref:matrixin family metalloprotease n=1 Tax=Arsukibacterium sp. TaxID=1977258 RepID=UPI002FDA5782
MLARLVFLSLLILGSYLLLSAWFSAERPESEFLKDRAEKALQQRLCQIPVLWRIGQLDPAFALTAEQAEQAAHNAAAQWNNALGLEVFRHDSLDGFPINFRYDERQQKMLQQALLQRNIQRYDSTIERRAATLQLQSEQLQQRQREFDQANQQFSDDIAAFEQQAASASPAQLTALRQQQQQLQQREQQLQQQAERLNAQQAQLQREYQYLNDTLADRNALLQDQQAPLAAEVGLMEIINGKRIMTIFAYSTPAALQLTLAHEFGHAMGLGHSEQHTDVMHYAINPQQQSLTRADIDALKQQCGF